MRKLRVGAAVGTLAALMLPLVNSLLARRGLPSVTADDVESAWDLGLAAYGSAAAVVAWVAAYLARPSAGDAPVSSRIAMYDPRPLIHLHRVEHLLDRTLSTLHVYDAGGVLRLDGWALEPPWRGQPHRRELHSAGLYDVRRRWSRRYREHLIVLGTAPRSFDPAARGQLPDATRAGASCRDWDAPTLTATGGRSDEQSEGAA